MPHAPLPMIPDGASPISACVSVVRQDERWTYFVGLQPVYEHPADDRKAFRMFTAQLCCQGACTQAEISRSRSTPGCHNGEFHSGRGLRLSLPDREAWLSWDLWRNIARASNPLFRSNADVGGG